MSTQRRVRVIVVWVFIALTTTTCISTVDIDSGVDEGIIVAEGFITDDFGPHKIYLSRIAKFSGTTDGGTIFRVDDALVTISDNEGNQIDLVNLAPIGLYLTPESFKGEVGKTYTLDVTLFNGRTYRSTPQTIPNGPEIDSLILQFKKLPSADPVTFDSGVEVFTQWQDPSGERNYYLWTTNIGTYELATRPDLAVGCLGQVCGVPVPKSCCSRCYRTDEINAINIREDIREDGEVITSLATFIQDDGMRFTNRYHIEINQYSVSAEAYDFHRVVGSQLDITGTIFDPPPANIRGNMSNVIDPDDVVIGYFGAYNVSKKSTFVPLSIIEEPQRPAEVRDDCRTLSRTVVEIPTFFTSGD